MADPFSVVVNIITVVAFATKSCQCVYKLLQGMSQAPKEIQQHIGSLKTLHLRLINIDALGNEIELYSRTAPQFSATMRECVLDFQTVELKLQKLAKKLKKGRLRRTMATVKWTFLREEWLVQFLARTQLYYSAFSIDLLAMHMKMSLAWNAQLIQGSNVSSVGTQRAIEPPMDDPSPPNQVNPGDLTITVVCDDQRVLPFVAEVGMKVEVNKENRLQAPIPYFVASIQPTAHRAVTMPFAYPVSEKAGAFLYTFFRKHIWIRWGTFEVYHPGHTNQKSILLPHHKRHYIRGFAIGVLWNDRSRMGTISWDLRCLGDFGAFSLHWNMEFPRVIPRESPIVRYIRARNIERVQGLFGDGRASPFDMLPDGTSQLHMAVAMDYYPMVQFLIQQGLDPNVANDDGDTPLHLALSKAVDFEIVRLLMGRGGNLGSRNIDGHTPLHTFFNSAIKQTLLSYQEDVRQSIVEDSGWTAFHFLAWSSKSEPNNFVPYLTELQRCCTERDSEGRTPLHLAAQRGNVGLIHFFERLLTNDMVAPDCSGKSLLHYAVESKRVETIDLILKRGADIQAADKRGRTALHQAILRDNVEATRQLIGLGGSCLLRSVDRDGNTPYKLAIFRKAQKCTKFIKDLESEEPICAHNTISQCVVRQDDTKRDKGDDTVVTTTGVWEMESEIYVLLLFLLLVQQLAIF